MLMQDKSAKTVMILNTSKSSDCSVTATQYIKESSRELNY